MRPHPLGMVIVVLALFLGAATVRAHPGAAAFWQIAVDGRQARSRVVVPLVDAGGPHETRRGPGDMGGESLERFARRLIAHFVVQEGEATAAAEVLGVRLLDDTWVEVEAVHQLSGRAEPLTLRATFHELTDPAHRVIARVEGRGPSRQILFTARSPQHLLAPRPPAAAAAQVRLGVAHILSGLDHLVFLCCLVLPGGSWRARVLTVTAFTIAHSVTLVLAAMRVVTPPVHVVEAAIAVSIAYVAIENLVAGTHIHRWPAAFGFGLVHGFGFAGMLDLMGMPRAEWLRAVLAFNFGVELGQLAVLAVVVPATALIAAQPWHRRAVQCTSVGILGLAVFWIVERLP